jgi:hypothetical protein
MKVFYGAMGLACVPAMVAATDNPYPKERVAEFVVERLDVTTLPPAIRPKPQKGKKTFAEYGYVTQQIGDKEAVLEVTPKTSQINIRVLDQESAGIFVCVEGQTKDTSSRIQRVYLLRMKGANTLLKARESWREFDGCPVLGSVDAETSGY